MPDIQAVEKARNRLDGCSRSRKVDADNGWRLRPRRCYEEKDPEPGKIRLDLHRGIPSSRKALLTAPIIGLSIGGSLARIPVGCFGRQSAPACDLLTWLTALPMLLPP